MQYWCYFSFVTKNIFYLWFQTFQVHCIQYVIEDYQSHFINEKHQKFSLIGMYSKASERCCSFLFLDGGTIPNRETVTVVTHVLNVTLRIVLHEFWLLKQRSTRKDGRFDFSRVRAEAFAFLNRVILCSRSHETSWKETERGRKRWRVIDMALVGRLNRA